MLRVKRRARGSNGQQEKRKRIKEVSSIISDCKDMVESTKQKLYWKELSQELATKFCASIVSLASFDGEKLHCECTGIVVENSLRNNTCILTSSALVSTSDRERRVIYRLKIKLRLPNNQVVDGWIQNSDLPFSMVVVVTRYSPDLRTVCFSNSMQVQRHTDLLALKRCFKSGKLMQTHGVPSDDDTSKIDSKGSMLSTCKITMDGSGGPLVDLDGNIVGMNDYHDQEGTPYVQGNKIDECLRAAWIRRDDVRRHIRQHISSACRLYGEGSSNQNGYSGGSESKNQKQILSSSPEPQALEFTEVPTPELIENEHKRLLRPWPSNDFTKMINALLDKDGYPLPAYSNGGMRLEGHFEEEFGKDILSEPARKIALKMSRSVVALASFTHDLKKRHFACTGVCIDFNGSTSTTRVLTSASLVRTSGDENLKNLKIRVCLPSNEYIDGELENCDFCYNVAVVSFPFRCNRPAMLVDAPQTEVLSLGRGFKSGNCMATEGSVTGKECKIGCEELKISTCKITKAGIGGPVVDFKGNVVGMNFYDTEGTPYLPSKIILKVLRSFDPKRPVAAEDPNDSSWPVPKPYRYYPSERKKSGPKVDKLCPDLKFALHALPFLSKLKKEIKGKLGGNNPRNNRRR